MLARNVHWHGHQTRSAWLRLLAESRFLIGLGASRAMFHRTECFHVYILLAQHHHKTAATHTHSVLPSAGDPLLGPSAIDAISMGCVYINPVYPKKVRGFFKTQHDYAIEKIGAPYVCNAELADVTSVLRCVDQALGADLPPFIPPDFRLEAYVRRVRHIFSLR